MGYGYILLCSIVQGWGHQKKAGLYKTLEVLKGPCLSHPAPKCWLHLLQYPPLPHRASEVAQRPLWEWAFTDNNSWRALLTAHCSIWYLPCCRISYQVLQRWWEHLNTQSYQMEFLGCLSKAPTRSGSEKTQALLLVPPTTPWLPGWVPLVGPPLVSLFMNLRTWILSDRRVPDL